jgi:hypothetical protein
MRGTLSAVLHVATMAAIVATLVYLPMGLVVALVAALFGVSFHALVTFGGALNAVLGLLAWWLFAFAGACTYAAWVFPWGDKVFAWPSRK